MTLSPDPASEFLGTGYSRFAHPSGVRGLCKIYSPTNRIDLLAVVADNPGKGQFREFIADLKKSHAIICIWHISNPWLEEVLLRYGFRLWSERFCFDNNWEDCEGVRWDG